MFDSLGVLVVHGLEMKIQQDGAIHLGYGRLISRANIRFFNGGDFFAESGTLEFSGVTWENKAGSTFNPENSTVIFNGTGSQKLIISDSAFFSFNNLEINSDSVTITGNLVVSGDCILADGSYITVGSGGSFTVMGTFTGDPNAVGGSGSSALPVQLTSFSASANRLDAVLRWSTATEVSNYGFAVERRRMDGSASAWTNVSFVQGHGTTSQPQEYSYTDGNLSPGRYAYRLNQIDFDGSSSYSFAAEVEVGIAAKALVLGPNYPNPFNPSTEIEFTIPESGPTTLKVFNMIGQLVGTLFNEPAEAGRLYRVTFSAHSLPSGIYFYRLESANQSLVKRMLLVK